MRATLSIQRSTDIGWRRSRKAASRIDGRLSASRFPRGGDAGKIAVGEGQRHDIRRRLAQIDRLDEIVERSGDGGQEVHVVSCQPTKIFSIAARFSPFSPITTSRERRSSSAVQARS